MSNPLQEMQRVKRRRESLQVSSAKYKGGLLLKGLKQVTIIVPFDAADKFKLAAKSAVTSHLKRLEEEQAEAFLPPEGAFTPENLKIQQEMDEDAERQQLESM